MKSLLISLVSLFYLTSNAQILLPSGTNISIYSEAGEGDLYEGENNEIYIGLQDGSLKEIGNVVANGSNTGDILTWNTTTQQWEANTLGTSSGWNLLGHTGTNDTTCFIGTTDDQALVFKGNSIIAGRIGPTKTGNPFQHSLSLGTNTISEIGSVSRSERACW